MRSRPHGRSVLSAGQDGTLRIWEIPADDRLQTEDRPELDLALNGLAVEMYAGRDFQTLKATRTDLWVDWDWGEGTPAPSVPRDDFSVRWTGWLKGDEPGWYRLILAGDDGLRLWLDGKLLIDKWMLSSANRGVSRKVELDGRPHRLRVEFFEGTGSAWISLRAGRRSTASPRKASPPRLCSSSNRWRNRRGPVPRRITSLPSDRESTRGHRFPAGSLGCGLLARWT